MEEQFQIYLAASETNIAEPIMPGEYFPTREAAQAAIDGWWKENRPELTGKLSVYPPATS